MKIATVTAALLFLSIIIMGVTIYLRIPFILLTINLLINFAYLIVKYYNKSEEEKVFSFVIHGEGITNILYTIWLFFIQSPEYIFYLSLCLSMSGKVHEMVIDDKERKNEAITENLIILQGKIEFLVLIHTTIVLLLQFVTMNFNTKAILMYLILALLFRLKYEMNYAFQRSINEIHLFYDKLFKRLQFRNGYQKCYKFIVKILFINDYNSGARILRY